MPSIIDNSFKYYNFYRTISKIRISVTFGSYEALLNCPSEALKTHFAINKSTKCAFSTLNFIICGVKCMQKRKWNDLTLHFYRFFNEITTKNVQFSKKMWKTTCVDASIKIDALFYLYLENIETMFHFVFFPVSDCNSTTTTTKKAATKMCAWFVLLNRHWRLWVGCISLKLFALVDSVRQEMCVDFFVSSF